ncbi:MAG: RrF2 family transcriptional regulator [bacterium]|nr:RrF2 family transcriptional regulator [bacterium]MCX7916719.1 RrF2 family transcriptional regulator [bacterium]MDW8164000.1 RrF2 family transcriptional regulator [Candidatus Omnitrophota bacterium]
MKFSTRTRYGLRALVDIGLNYKDKFVLVKDISKRQNISNRYLEHILLSLKKAGILKSVKGMKGGFTFLKKPSEIKIKEIVEILEGKIVPVECVEKKEICERSESCAVRDLWCLLKSEIEKFLNSITLEELIERQKEKEKKKKVIFYEI